MGSSSSEVLYVPHHDVKQSLQPITSFLVTALNPKCTALQFTYLASPFFPCLQVQIAQQIFPLTSTGTALLVHFKYIDFIFYKGGKNNMEDWYNNFTKPSQNVTQFNGTVTM